MCDGYPAVGLILLLVLVLFSAVLYGFLYVYDDVNEDDIKEDAKNGDRRAKRVLYLRENSVEVTNSVHITSIVICFVIGDVVFRSICPWVIDKTGLSDYYAVLGVRVGIALCVILFTAILGFLVPKKIFCRHAKKWSYKLAGIVRLLMIIMTPFTALVTVISNGIVRLHGADPNADEENVTEEGIMTMVNEGQEQGVLLASEAEMINNIFAYGDKEAKDIMTHRTNIVALDGNVTISQVFEQIIDESYSRYPVYDKDLDDIIGIMHFKDFVKCHSDGYLRNYSLIDLKDEILYKPIFIPETRNIDDLFKSMQSEKAHMAVVVDEYGQTSGLVTMEDILEEIVGNIMDEHDDEEETIVKNSNDTYEVDGSTHKDELEELLGIEFDDDDVETLNGFLINKYERLPQEGDTFIIEYRGFRFNVVEVSNRMIKKVIVTKMEESSNE